MGYEIQLGNVDRPLLFLMVDSADHISGKVGLHPAVLLSKAGGPLAACHGAISEVGTGWYMVAPDAIDANILAPLLLHATAAGADPCDDTFEVVNYDPAGAAIPAPAAEISTDATRGAVEDRLVLGGNPVAGAELAYVKLYLRVDHDADDDLIGAFITAAKQQADGFLNNPFTPLRSVVLVQAAAVGDSVGVDGMTFRVAATEPASRSQLLLLQDFAIDADDTGTAVNLTAIINDATYGALSVLATRSGTEVVLTWRSNRKSAVTAYESTSRLAVRQRRVNETIPTAVAQGVLRTIAALYDQRQDGIGAIAISGQGSTTYGAPPLALDLWRPYRRMPGT